MRASERAYKWHPIEDLPVEWDRLRDEEMPALGRLWQDQRARMLNAAAVEQFNEQLRREWAIETGIIERLYSLDRGITRLLIEQGLDASLIPHGATDKPADLVIAIIRDQHSALEGLLDFVGSQRPLSTSYIKEVHQLLTTHQETVEAVDPLGRIVRVPLLRGQWKDLPNNPHRGNGTSHEYCPPEHVAAEMDRLIAMHLCHLELGIPPEVEGAWLHHRFTQIHPFQDGNGRVARLLATLVFLKASWFPLVIRRDDQPYIPALEAADHGDLGQLVQLFVRIERQALMRAIGLSEQVVGRVESRTQLIESIAAKLKKRRQTPEERMRNVFDLVLPLLSMTKERLQETRSALEEALSPLDERFRATTSEGLDDGSQRHWFRWQVVQAARELHYWADLGTYHSWFRLRLREESETNVIVSFHSYGETFRGVLGCSVFTFRKEASDSREGETTDVRLACRDFFQLNYVDDPPTVAQRFSGWLEEALATALEDWRRQL